MPRSTRGPRPATSGTEDRKAIEQRARDAAVPFAPEKKGQWPFPIEDMDSADGADGKQEIKSASDCNNASDRNNAGNNASSRNGVDQSVRSSQADQ